MDSGPSLLLMSDYETSVEVNDVSYSALRRESNEVNQMFETHAFVPIGSARVAGVAFQGHNG